ncbi:hypothetical protein B9Z55_026965 [Caenorhabditis nigoni]|uniref:Mos1 transposase HTH domain-containing protein n=1 Tax=Caenorhabditis nigoni TaxID=1611254 RepID=A0A2G5SIU4_9PELO|nr:hypothetical protein B9Z55_026965 [Caenorhabditis nigoni]
MTSKLSEASRKDPKFRAGMIFYEFQLGKPIFDSYKNFCHKMGSNIMNYPEFEFWFQRFSAGNFDLDYDRSKDQKYRTITDLPVHIFGKICENLGEDYQKYYWFTLRHVCKSFRDIVDSWNPPKFERIEIECHEESMFLKFDWCIRVFYIKKSENSSEIKVRDSAEVACSGDYRDLAVDDLMSVLASPEGYKLEKLIISGNIDKRFAQKLSDKFENLAANVDVDTVELIPAEDMDPIAVNKVLNLFQSIEEIDIKANDNQSVTPKYLKSIIDKINGIEALKERVVNIDSSLNYRDHRELLIPRGLRIPKMRLDYFYGPGKKVQIVQILLESPHLEYCHFDASWGRTGDFEGDLMQFGAEKDPKNPNMFKYRIPNSHEFFEIKIKGNVRYINGIYIERKSNSA